MQSQRTEQSGIPSADLAGALISPKVQHRASITEPQVVGGLMRAIDGQPTTRATLQVIAVTFVRPGELRHAEWKEFDTKNAVWSIPAEKMKMADYTRCRSPVKR
jgi:integrase